MNLTNPTCWKHRTDDQGDQYWDVEITGILFRILHSGVYISWSAVSKLPYQILEYQFADTVEQAMQNAADWFAFNTKEER